MAGVRYISHDEAKQKAMKDPEYKRAYRLLKPRYDIVRNMIQLRRQIGLTQKELAKHAGTHQSRISKIESAELDVRLSTMIQIADALNADVRIELVPRKTVEYMKPIFSMNAKSSRDTWPVTTQVKHIKEKVFA